MNTWDLKADQLDRIRRAVANRKRYFKRLLARCRVADFPEGDPLRIRAMKCVQEMGQLEMLLSHLAGELNNGRRRPGMRRK